LPSQSFLLEATLLWYEELFVSSLNTINSLGVLIYLYRFKCDCWANGRHSFELRTHKPTVGNSTFLSQQINGSCLSDGPKERIAFETTLWWMFAGRSVTRCDNLPLPKQPLSNSFNLSESNGQSVDGLLMFKCLMFKCYSVSYRMFLYSSFIVW